jgi:ABC-type sugar transport systems, permease components
MKHKKMSREQRSMCITGYLFLAPAILLWAYWFIIPALKSFWLSFYKYNYAKPLGNHFIGLDNYIRLFQDPSFYSALTHTLIMVVAIVPVQTILSLIIAVSINQKIRFRGFFRTVYYMPYVISSVAVATVFMYLFVGGKALPTLFSFFGMDNVSWMTDLRYALPLVILMCIWQQVGFYMVIFLSGLQTVPREVYESASIDGAGGFKSFRYITLPLLKPVTLLVTIYGLISAFQVFDQIATLSGSGQLGSPAGSTSTLVTFFYLNSFKFGDVGYGSASVVVLFVIVFSLTLIQTKLTSEKE